jgi:carboxymethylenebutenolidase
LKYLSEPAPGRAAKGVIVLQEYWGVNDHIQDVADRFAIAGLTALAPDLYHGTVARSPDEAMKLLMALNIAQAEKDLRGAVAHLWGLTGKPVGIVGFCMGGTLSFFAACANGKDVGACVIYYGGHPKVEYDYDRLTAPVLGHWAEQDNTANQNAARIEAELKRRGKSCEFHRYPGTKHAFFNDTRPEVYDREAATQSWDRTLAFFHAHL